MLRAILHRAVAHPAIYDFTQRIAGGGHVADCLRDHIGTRKDSAKVVADIGGGTGLFRHLWPNAKTYICGELDAAKLGAYHQRFTNDHAVCMDGAMALAPESCDAIMIVFVLHHVPDEAVNGFLEGCVKALRPGGALFIADPVWAPRRIAGRMLWSVDRGSHPRTPDTLRDLVSAHISITNERSTSVYHEYWIATGEKQT